MDDETFHVTFTLEQTGHRIHHGPLNWNRAQLEAGALRNTRDILNVEVVSSSEVNES